MGSRPFLPRCKPGLLHPSVPLRSPRPICHYFLLRPSRNSSLLRSFPGLPSVCSDVGSATSDSDTCPFFLFSTCSRPTCVSFTPCLSSPFEFHSIPEDFLNPGRGGGHASVHAWHRSSWHMPRRAWPQAGGGLICTVYFECLHPSSFPTGLDLGVPTVGAGS